MNLCWPWQRNDAIRWALKASLKALIIIIEAAKTDLVRWGLQAYLEGPGQAPLIIWTLNFFYIYIYHQHKFTALFFSAHSRSTAHICWRWDALPFADHTFRFRSSLPALGSFVTLTSWTCPVVSLSNRDSGSKPKVSANHSTSWAFGLSKTQTRQPISYD